MPEGFFPTTHLPHGVRLATPFACACCFSVGETARHAGGPRRGARPVRSLLVLSEGQKFRSKNCVVYDNLYSEHACTCTCASMM